jgi:Mrp family chromosome partitioning ATPase
MRERYEYREREEQEERYKPPVRELEDFTSKTIHLGMKDDIISLYRSINAALSGSQKKVIQFIGSREGEGTSTIVREFAMVSAKRFSKSVLLLDADIHKPSQHSFFNISPRYSCEDVMKYGEPIDNALYQVGNSRLFVSIMSGHSTSSHQFFDSLRSDNFWDKLQEFDLILVDSSPATTSSDGLSLSRIVDGVVLVVEAEETRWPIAISVKDKIEKNGGKILGITLNKRRHYIPEFIYNKL